MSDFLAHLVARATAPGPAIRPRLPALFEPSVAPAAQASAAPAPESLDVDAALPAPRDRRRQSEGVQYVEHDDSRADREPRTIARGDEGTRRPPSVYGFELPPNDQEREPAAPAQMSGAIQNPQPIVVDHTIRVDRPTVVERRVQVEETRRIETVERREQTVDRARPPAQRSAAAPMRSREASSIRPAPGTPSPVPQPAAQPLGADSAPTVEITIGRVEIRAVQPPAPTRRPAAERRGPSLSLEDYLKERNRGRG
jgi:hypothetical protein